MRSNRGNIGKPARSTPHIHSIGKSSFDIRSKWAIDAPLSELQVIISDPMSILTWWSSVFIDGEALNAQDKNSPKGRQDIRGFRARFYTKGFLPHAFQFIARIEELSPNHLVIETEGDFKGIGTIKLKECDGCAVVDVHWSVTVVHPYLWPFLRILKPVFVWNHLWAMRRGRQGLIEFIKQECTPDRPFQKPTFPHNLAFFRTPRQWRV